MLKTHSEILISINTLFENSSFDVDFDTDDSKDDLSKHPHIYLKYSPETKNKETLSNYKSGGVLRIFIYDKNPTYNLMKMDELLLFLDNKNIDGLEYNEFLISNTPLRENVGDLFTSFIDFDVRSCRGSLK